MIDLHMHSTFSDGTFTPEELVAEGAKVGLKAMALTDHDTTDGVPRFLAAAKTTGIRAISGVEVSADFTGGALHMLGYGVDPSDTQLRHHLRWIREGRDARNHEIMRKLHTMGIRITMDEIRAFAKEEVVARPHFAQVLIAKGFARDKKDAFEKYLGKGRPAYAERRRLSAEDTAELIRAAGGIPVMAHPFTLNLSKQQMRALLVRLKEAGLLGLEVYYSEHTVDMERDFLKLANEFGLVPTGGSDFHGANSPAIRMGRGFGSLVVPDVAIDRIEALLGT
jgi:hypothetical protein